MKMSHSNCKGERFGHNFPATGVPCMVCGITQAELSGIAPVKDSMESISSMGGTMERIQARAEAYKPRRGIHTELQDLVAQLRKEYGETAIKGKGSFSFYMGFLKKFHIGEVYAMQKRAQTGREPVKTFWWLVGDALKKRKKADVTRETSPDVTHETKEGETG